MRAAQATSAFPAAFKHGGKAAFFVISEIIRRDFMKLKFFFDYLSYAVPACAFSLLAKLFSYLSKKCAALASRAEHLLERQQTKLDELKKRGERPGNEA